MRYLGKTAEAKRIADEHRKKGLKVLDLKDMPQTNLRGRRLDFAGLYYNIFGKYPE